MYWKLKLQTVITTLDKNTQDAKSAVLDSCGDSDAVDKYDSYIQNLVKSNTMSTEFYRNLETLSRNAPNTVGYSNLKLIRFQLIIFQTVIATTINNDYFNEADLSISQSISVLMVRNTQFIVRNIRVIFRKIWRNMCSSVVPLSIFTTTVDS